MAKKHLKQKTEVHLTDKALRDIAGIREYSIQNFGTRVAGKYIAAIEAALARIKAHPALLRSEEGFHPWFMFYRVEKHLLVCDVYQNDIFLLTLLGTSQSIPERLNDLEPMLKLEVELLHVELRKARSTRK